MRKHHSFLWMLVVLIMTTGSVIGQSNIKTELVLTDTSSYKFTSEWQYLSTDIYLFNGEKFNNLINELNFNKKKDGGLFNFKKEQNEFLEYLYITASLKNVRFFDDKEITYPLYNFRINQEKENKYRTYISEDIDHIRIIDNLPLYTTSDYIDAEINVHAITNNERDQVLGLVADQLRNISKIANPSKAVLALVGELGNFMESSSRKKEYHFSSTIRLYEKKDFDSRLHSIMVYAMTTENSEGYEIKGKELDQFLKDQENKRIDRETLDELIDFKEYPYLIVANYKSLYRMDAVSGDEITFATIERRKLNIENDFQDGLISEETYLQEKDFLKFLEIFANLKKSLEMYKLNYKTGNNEALTSSLFEIIQHYHHLMQTYKHYKFKYRNNNTFYNIFQAEYESILEYARLYLEKDHYLNNAQELVEIRMYVDTIQIDKTDSLERERLLSKLHFADIFDQSKIANTTEGKSILEKIKKLEKIHFSRHFEEPIRKAQALNIQEEVPVQIRELKYAAKTTNCKTCRDSAVQTINQFYKKHQDFLKKIELKKADSLRNVYSNEVISLYGLLDDIEYNLAVYYNKDSANQIRKIFETKFKRARRDAGNLEELVNKDFRKIESVDLEVIQNYTTKLEDYASSVRTNTDFICEHEPRLCQPEKKTRQLMQERREEKLKKEYESIKTELLHKVQSLQQTTDSLLSGTSFRNQMEDTLKYQQTRKILESLDDDFKSVKQKAHRIISEENIDTKMKIEQLQEVQSNLQKMISEFCVEFPEFCLFYGIH